MFFDVGEPHVFDGGTFEICESPTGPTTVPLTYSLSVAEGCDNSEPVVNFTNTGTGTIYASIDIFAQQVSPGATVTASWPVALGDLVEQSEWHADEFSDPMGDIGPEFATGTVFLANACGDTTGPVDRPNGVIRNIALRLRRRSFRLSPSRRRVWAASCSSERPAGKSSEKSKPMSTWSMPTGARATSSCCSPVEGRGDGLQMAARSRSSAATTGWLPTSSMSSPRCSGGGDAGSDLGAAL